MKNLTSLFGKAFLLVAVLIFCGSCEKSPQMDDINDNSVQKFQAGLRIAALVDSETPITIVSKNLDDQYLYVTEHLKTIGEGIAFLSADKEFRKTVYKEIEKKPFSDTEVLIESIFNTPYVKNSSPNSSMKSVTKNDNILRSINSFQGINKQNFFPQIYIPNYENLKSKFFKENPIFVFYNGDESIESLPGYVLKNSQLVLTGYNVDEKFAEGNEVWVISLNENVDNEGKPGRNSDSEHKGARLMSDGGRITTMIVKDRCESFFGGQTDVYIYGGSTFINGIDPNTGSEANWRVPRSDRSQIRNFSKSEVENETEITVNYNFYPFWDPFRPEPGPRGDYFFYVIYEADNWPASLRNWPAYVGTKQYTMEYRSSCNLYWAGSFNKADLASSGVSIGYNDLPYPLRIEYKMAQY